MAKHCIVLSSITKKAFDSVDRIALWHKLLDNSSDGNFIRISHNMYNVAV